MFLNYHEIDPGHLQLEYFSQQNGHILATYIIQLPHERGIKDRFLDDQWEDWMTSAYLLK